VAAQLAAFQEGLNPMELIGVLIDWSVVSGCECKSEALPLEPAYSIPAAR
jgi:hypothetical protein